MPLRSSLISLLVPALLLAQATSPVPPQSPSSVTFRAEANLALVRFQVVANNGRLIQDLGPDDIEIHEDGVPQTVALFQGGRTYPRTTPIEIHMLFDRSGSVQRAKVSNPRQFHVDLLEEFPHASIAVWGFGGPPVISTDNGNARATFDITLEAAVRLLYCFTLPTRDAARLNWAMESVTAMDQGDTPLYQAIAEVARQAGNSAGDSVRMLVVVSDGVPSRDASTSAQALQAAQRAGVSIFPVLLHAEPGAAGPRLPRAVYTRFTGLAEPTGGRSFEVRGAEENALLSQILKWVGDTIRYDYVAGFYPSSSGEKKLHSVQVVLKDPKRGKIVAGARQIEH